MFNPEDFRKNKPELLKLIARDLESGKELTSSVTSIAQGYGVPLVCIYTFIMEEWPEHVETCAIKIKQLNEFMGIKLK